MFLFSKHEVCICIHHVPTAHHYEFFHHLIWNSSHGSFPLTSHDVIANSIALKYKQLNREARQEWQNCQTITGQQWRLGATGLGEALWQRLFPTVLQCNASHYLQVLTEGTSPRWNTGIPEATFILYSYSNSKNFTEAEITVKYYLAIYCLKFSQHYISVVKTCTQRLARHLYWVAQILRTCAHYSHLQFCKRLHQYISPLHI